MQHTREAEDDFENPYYDLGSICPHDLISFAYQIASGMVGVCKHRLPLEYHMLVSFIPD